MTNELGQLVLVHERNVINMAEDLAIQHHCRRHTLVAHTQRVRLVVFAGVVNLVAYILHKCAVLALRIRRMTLLAFLPLLHNPVVKRLVLKNLVVSLYAVRALATRWVLTQRLNGSILCVLFGDTKAVYALLIRPMSAFRFLILFICHLRFFGRRSRFLH